MKMKLKKRCDFCLKLKPENLQANEKIINKELKNVFVNVAGVEVTSEQLSRILTCYDCAIAIVHAEPIVLKVRNLLKKLSKPKGRKRKSSATVNGTVDASNEQSTYLENDETNPGDGPKPPEKITVRRKSVANDKNKTKTKNNSVINDEELGGTPVASSTMAVISSTPAEKKKEIKKPPKKKAKINDKKNEDTPDAQTGNHKIPISEKIKNTSPSENNLNKINKKQRAESGNFDGDEVNFQQNVNGDNNVHQCMECGKSFVHFDRFESHVLGEKCKKAEYACKDPSCMRRFFKLKKMYEHMQRKHPEWLQSESPVLL